MPHTLIHLLPLLPESLSNTQLKNRLLGAGLLVLLAVLLIPLFLGEPKYIDQEIEAVESTEFESRIQPLPDAAQVEKALPDSPKKSEQRVFKKLDNNPVVKTDTADKTDTAQNSQVSIQPLKLDTLAESPGQSAKKVDPKVAAGPDPENNKPDPVATKITSGWAVQAGIFSKVENANAIAVTLKNNGYSPNISDAKGSFGKAKRVWVGPFASKSEAQAISKQLEQLTGDGGYVAAYPFKS